MMTSLATDTKDYFLFWNIGNVFNLLAFGANYLGNRNTYWIFFAIFSLLAGMYIRRTKKDPLEEAYNEFIVPFMILFFQMLSGTGYAIASIIVGMLVGRVNFLAVVLCLLFPLVGWLLCHLKTETRP